MTPSDVVNMIPSVFDIEQMLNSALDQGLDIPKTAEAIHEAFVEAMADEAEEE